MQQKTIEHSAFILQLSGNLDYGNQFKNYISLPHLTPKLVILGELDSSNSEFILKPLKVIRNKKLNFFIA